MDGIKVMNKNIFCQKLQQDLPALTQAPIKGELGERILKYISQPAWDMWLSHQTTLINEYRLSLIDPKAKSFLMTEMEKFLFKNGSSKPSGFIPEK